jgi:hypothetical protein
MRGIDITNFVPLHMDALERRPGIRSWLEDICSDLKPVFFKPEDWFEQAHNYSNSVWTPPVGRCRSGGGSVGKMEVETAGVRTPSGGPPAYDGAMATSLEARDGFLFSC